MWRRGLHGVHRCMPTRRKLLILRSGWIDYPYISERSALRCFLLSGYVIALSLERYCRSGFLLGRLWRVLPTYAAGYGISCLVVALMGDPQQELHLTSIATGAVPGLSFLLGTTVPGDGIVWTLIIEMVFYAVCLITYQHLARRWEIMVAIALGCCALQTAMSPPVLGNFWGGLGFITLLACPFIPVMLIGVLLSAHQRKAVARIPAMLLFTFLLLVHAYLAKTTVLAPNDVSYRWTFLGTIGLFTLLWLMRNTRWRYRFFEHLARISYPLYVVHPVMGYALLSWLSVQQVPAWLAFGIALLSAFTMAALLHRFVEQPTHHIGQRWARRFSTCSKSLSPALT